MPELHPFRALRYSPATGSPSALLAPPYDVIDEAEAERLRSLHPSNAVRLVLPEGGDPERYESAAELLRAWRADGTLELDASPTVTVYRQEFPGPQGPLSRLALFGAVSLTPLDRGEVLPHERTHSGPKRDRLALTLAARTQMSPVFLTLRDDDGALYRALLEITEAEPDARASTPDGVSHAVWRIADPVRIEALRTLARSGPFLIADGHHRYETALEVKRRAGEELPGADRVLACIVSESDPGLRIRATHRAVPVAPPPARGTTWQLALADPFELHPLPTGRPDEAWEYAESHGTMVLVSGVGAWELRPRAAALTDAGLDEADAAVPSVVLDRLVVGRTLGLDADGAARDGLLAYFRDPLDAVRHAGQEGAAFLLPAVSRDAVWKVTSLGRRLPPKSTYYEPKIPSGLLFRPLDDDS